MDTSSSKENDAIQQNIKSLADILDSNNLTHLEYKDDTAHVVLKRECVVQPSSLQGHFQVKETSQQYSGNANRANVVDAPMAEAGATQADAPMVQVDKASTAEEEQSTTSISAPIVGLAYRSKEPGAAPFVGVGDLVSKGATLCLIEAMKTFNEVKAPAAGTVSKIHFNDGDLVEFGALLFTLDS